MVLFFYAGRKLSSCGESHAPYVVHCSAGQEYCIFAIFGTGDETEMQEIPANVSGMEGTPDNREYCDNNG
jgi:hypothetical protein